MKSFNLLPYAMDFCSYLLQRLTEKKADLIRTIIFFGSGARGEARSKSDVDIFVETEGDTGDLERDIDKLTEQFYDSVKYREYWKLLGIRQVLSVKVGNPEEWKNLYPALLADGKVLFGKYFSTNVQGKGKMLFSWENVQSQQKRTNIYRSLFGYRDRGKSYAGYVEKYKAQRLSKGSILVPVEHGQVFRDLFKKLKVPVVEKTLIEV
jgi:predicted nucleotidyltransferase